MRSLMPSAGGRHQYLRGAGALFDTYRLGPGEQADFRGISWGISAHGEIAGGHSVEQETAVAVRFGVAGTFGRLQFHHGSDRRADAAGIVGRVQIAEK